MDLRKFSDEQLLDSTLALAGAERRLVCVLLHHLNEIAARRLFSKESFPSMFEYCVRVLGFSNSQAQTRVCAARLLQEFPEIEEKINQGNLHLCAAAQAHVFFRRNQISKEKKVEILLQIENKSSREAERVFRTLDPKTFREVVRPISESQTEFRFAADKDLSLKLERLKQILRVQSIAELIRKMADVTLQKFDPVKKAERNLKVANRRNAPTTFKVKPTRYIPAQIRHQVWLRDQGRCTYPACSSQFALELDHILPFAKGGQHSAENLRLRCQAHNQLHAAQEFGEKKLSLRRKISSHRRG